MQDPTLSQDHPERDFLHDLANPLAVVYGHLRILASKLEGNPEEVSGEEILQKINRALVSFEKANDLLDARRAFLNREGL